MENPTVHQIIADYANEKGVTVEESTIELSTHGFIKPTTIVSQPPRGFVVQHHTYELTYDGRKILAEHSNFVEYFKAKAVIDRHDEERERLLLQDLRDRVHNLNPAQSSVLRGTWERHKQTILLGIIVALIATTVTIMVKIWGH